MTTPRAARLSALTALAVAAILLSACGGSSGESVSISETAPDPSPTSAESNAEDPAEVAVEPAADDAAEPGIEEDEPTPEAAPPAEYAEALGWEPVVLLTPLEDVGARPVFTWEAVPGASGYLLILLDPDGAGYWSWEGEATEIVLGGVPVLGDGIAGPALSPGMTWSVSAYGDELRVIGLSELRPISP